MLVHILLIPGCRGQCSCLFVVLGVQIPIFPRKYPGLMRGVESHSQKPRRVSIGRHRRHRPGRGLPCCPRSRLTGSQSQCVVVVLGWRRRRRRGFLGENAQEMQRAVGKLHVDELPGGRIGPGVVGLTGSGNVAWRVIE